MNALLELSLRGSLVFLLVLAADRLSRDRLRSACRRLWWVLVPIAFLTPWHAPLLLPAASPNVTSFASVGAAASLPIAAIANAAETAEWPKTALTAGLWIWFSGVAALLGITAWQTLRVLTRWPHERLSTDSALLTLLEDCKLQVGVTAPIGVVVSARTPAPAILGWLRPRILLPADLVQRMPPEQLRAVLLHELAHFRSADVPLNWLFLLARIVHWYNPLVHLAARAWAHYREEAADEAAVRNLAGDPELVRRALQATLQPAAPTLPFSALGINESYQQLKHRIKMLPCHTRKLAHWPLSAAVAIVLATVAFLQPAQADEAKSSNDEKTQISNTALAWLQVIDAGKYEQSWQEASTTFQSAISAEKWSAALNSVRKPLNASLSRRLVSFVRQSKVPRADGTMIEGEFAMMQFESSFENVKYALETVTFKQEVDGKWKAAGYFVKPR